MRFFNRHDADVIREATARLVPGPADDPREQDSPGAREAGVVDYIDRLLSSLDGDEAEIYAADAAAGPSVRFVPLTRAQRDGWCSRINRLRDRYRAGIAMLDAMAGGDFATATAERRDAILATESVAPFRDLLFEHTIEGMYSLPVYGGNRNLLGWHSIDYRGNRQPEGYPAAEVERSDGPDALAVSPVVEAFLRRHHRAAWFALGSGDG